MHKHNEVLFIKTFFKRYVANISYQQQQDLYLVTCYEIKFQAIDRTPSLVTGNHRHIMNNYIH